MNYNRTRTAAPIIVHSPQFPPTTPSPWVYREPYLVIVVVSSSRERTYPTHAVLSPPPSTSLACLTSYQGCPVPLKLRCRRHWSSGSLSLSALPFFNAIGDGKKSVMLTSAPNRACSSSNRAPPPTRMKQHAAWSSPPSPQPT
jgi:hypothetical protein